MYSRHTMRKTIRITLVIFQFALNLLLVQVSSALTLNDGLIGYWSFDESSGITAEDLSGYDNTGTLVNGPNRITGVAGNALSFDGINDYVEINDNTNLDLTGGEFTFSAWIYPESYGESSNGRIIDHGGGFSGTDPGGWSFLVNNYLDVQNLRVSIKDGYNKIHIYSNIDSITLNTWQHVAVTFISGTLTFYVNGHNQGELSGVPVPTDRSGPIRIGMSIIDYWRAFTGVIDEVRIYNRALESQEIQELFDLVSPLSDLLPPVLSNGQPSGFFPQGTTSTTLTINTDESATCKYEPSTEIPYSSMSYFFSTTGGTAHTISISGLQNGQIYYFFVRCRDQVGNSNSTDYPISFSIESDEPLNDGLIAHWKFDEETGLTALDSSGNNNTGTLFNGPVWSAGIINNSLSFDGINDYVEINDNNSLDLTGGDFTLSAWIYPETFGESSSGTIIGHGANSSNEEGGWDLNLNNESGERNLRLTVKDGYDKIYAYSNIDSINLYEWQHVAVSLKFGTVTFYVNSQDEGQTALVPTPTNRDAPVRIGMRATNFLRTFTGVIDNIRVYDRALPSQYVWDLYDQVQYPSDTTPPILSDGDPSGILPPETTWTEMSINTDEPATCKYGPSADIAYSGMSYFFSSTGGTTHTTTISNLQDGGSYSYNLKCRDQAGNANSNANDATLSFSVHKGVFHISPLGSDSNPGSNVSPWGSIQHAIDSVKGNEIYNIFLKVAQGTYYENISVTSSVSKIIVQGGWSSDFNTRNKAPSLTVINGNKAGHVINISSETADIVIKDIIIDGFTITGSGDTESGIRCNNCQEVTIRNNIIIDNGHSTTSDGISLFKESTVLIEQNIISGNATSGIYLRGESQANIRNNIIVDNLDTGIYRAYADPELNIISYITNNVIASNGTKYGGRAGIMTFSNDEITNNIIINNGSRNNPNTGLSVGIYVGSADPTITHNDVCYKNEETNELLACKNFEDDYTIANPNFVLDLKELNKSVEPEFMTNENCEYYHIDENSQLRDAGTNTNAPLFDFEGNDRPFNGITDIGVDEYVGPLSSVPYYCDKDNDQSCSIIESATCNGFANEPVGCLSPGNDCIDNDPYNLSPGSDCNDYDPYMHPGNPEICDNKDNNCDGEPDNGLVDCIVSIPYYEDFENVLDPDWSWTIIDNAGTSAEWRFDDPANRSNLTGGNNHFAIADSDYYGVVTMDTELHTPIIDILNLDKFILEFKTDFYYYSKFETADVDVSMNGTEGPWINIWQKRGVDYRGPHTEILDLSELVFGHNNVVIRFHYYNARNDWWWQIDDVKLSGTECNEPPTRIGSSSPVYYSSIQDAYNAAGNNDTIQVRAGLYDKSPAFNEDKSVILKGGYDCSYNINTGKTILDGNLTIADGTIIIENIIVGQ